MVDVVPLTDFYGALPPENFGVDPVLTPPRPPGSGPALAETVQEVDVVPLTDFYGALPPENFGLDSDLTPPGPPVLAETVQEVTTLAPTTPEPTTTAAPTTTTPGAKVAGSSSSSKVETVPAGPGNNYGFPRSFGIAGEDFPLIDPNAIPKTSFTCSDRVLGG